MIVCPSRNFWSNSTVRAATTLLCPCQPRLESYILLSYKIKFTAGKNMGFLQPGKYILLSKNMIFSDKKNIKLNAKKHLKLIILAARKSKIYIKYIFMRAVKMLTAQGIF